MNLLIYRGEPIVSNYFIKIPKGELGPFSIDEIKRYALSCNTLIRTNGEHEWVAANRLVETTSLARDADKTSDRGIMHWGEFQKDGKTKNGYRQYSSILWDIPSDVSWEDSCALMPATVRGHKFSSPSRCKHDGLHMWGEFDVPDTAFSNPSSLGNFIGGNVQAEWMPDGRRMRLLRDFSYVDPHGIRWDAPADSIVDGASIPQSLWSIIGGPFEGVYRNASVIHDIACDLKVRPWTDVHWVFHEAMLASGVDPVMANIMFTGVWARGPRW